MIYDASLDKLLQKVWDGKRIDQAEALRLYHLPLEELGALADRRRQLAKADAYGGHGNEIVTYIVDRNVNYTRSEERRVGKEGRSRGWQKHEKEKNIER